MPQDTIVQPHADGVERATRSRDCLQVFGRHCATRVDGMARDDHRGGVMAQSSLDNAA